VCVDPFAVTDVERNRAGWAIHITAPAASSEHPAPLPLRVHGLDKAARSELMALLRDERDTLDYLQRDPEAMGSTFARALVAALWRRFPARPALRAAYFSRWGRVVDGRDCGDAGPALFRALFAAFRALLSPEALEPPDPTALAGAAVARAHAGKPADAVPSLAAAVDASAAAMEAAAAEAVNVGEALHAKHVSQVARLQQEMERHLKEKEKEAARLDTEARQNKGVKAAIAKLLQRL
jgi:hypothetical protein